LNLILDESMLLTGIDAISLVEYPAIEEDFIALNSQRVSSQCKAMRSASLWEQHSYPTNPSTEQKARRSSMCTSAKPPSAKQGDVLSEVQAEQRYLEHDYDVKGLTVVESWIIEDDVQDKSKKYGFDLPVGTWMVSMKVNNEIWTNFVKTGEFRGFSIEGYFVDKLNLAKQEMAQI
jgi:hypothetical protein